MTDEKVGDAMNDVTHDWVWLCLAAVAIPFLIVLVLRCWRSEL